MKRALFIGVSTAVAAICVVTASFAAERPNVIVVITDDQGYADMSCHGNPVLKTPEMDRLHDDSVRLTDFHVDPTCSPTRAALMTGRYSARTGVWLTYGSRHHLRRDEVTMADVFKQNGYKTAIFGKWHLGDNYPFRPMDRGFEESLIHGGGVIGETPDYWDNNYYDDIYFRNGEPERVEGYCTDVWFNETLRFAKANRDQPFFVYLSTNAPHGPLHVPEKYRKPYEKDHDPRRAAFYGMVANIDENLGRLRKGLKKLSLDRNTIVVFLNDNGTIQGVNLDDKWNGWETDGWNAGMRGKKTSQYEGGHRAACFIRWPNGGLIGGRDVVGVTAHIDLLPTLIDLCELEFEDSSRFDGISLTDALKSGQAPDRTLVVHDQGRFGEPLGNGPLIEEREYSVMQGSWRLVDGELYHLQTDPSQRIDIAKQHPELAERLHAEYGKWWDHVSERADEYCPFVINPTKQQITLISSQNYLGDEVAYSQRSVRKGDGGEGWTMIDVEIPGRYRIALRRWPRESGLGIRQAAPEYPMHPSTHLMMAVPNNALDVVKARLRVGSLDQIKVVHENDQEILFEMDLSRGEQRLQTWFTLRDGGQKAAYYVYIEPAL